jgi:putative ABC transport system ATP-binding protein
MKMSHSNFRPKPARPTVLQLEHVVKNYPGGSSDVRAIDDVSLTIAPGTFTALIGPSGAGKSTLLHLMGGLDRPTSGRVLLEGRNLAELTDRELTFVRRRRVGFVFQFFNLLPNLTVWENIALPLLLDSVRPAQAKARAAELATRLQIQNRLDTRAALLSGGEMQRTAIGRAVAHDPALILADEPTGNLDRHTGIEVVKLLREAVVSWHWTVVMVSHDLALAREASRIIKMVDGKLESDGQDAPASYSQT